MALIRSLANKLLAALPEHERRDVLERSVALELRAGDEIDGPGAPVRHVYFPAGCVVSVQLRVDGGDLVEAGLIGREGACGALPLSSEAVPLAAQVQCTGRCFRLRREDFARLLGDCPGLRSHLDAHRRSLLAQLRRAAACSCRHHLERRVARWLLMTQDRLGASTFRLSHELLARALDARGGGVRVALKALQGQGMIAAVGATITVVNRGGLVTGSCECYEA